MILRGLAGLLLAWSCTSAQAEVSTRLTGDAAGPGCATVAVALTRTRLSYPLLGGMGWSRGVPKASRPSAELYLYRAEDRSVRRVLEIPAPRQWDDYTRFSMSPRILPDGSLYFTLAGCSKANPNCAEQRYFRVVEGARVEEVAQWPQVSPQESHHLQQCTSNRLYPQAGVQIAIGPTGGPWQPVLLFADGQLSVISP